jgi:hypothetical protein
MLFNYFQHSLSASKTWIGCRSILRYGAISQDMRRLWGNFGTTLRSWQPAGFLKSSMYLSCAGLCIYTNLWLQFVVTNSASHKISVRDGCSRWQQRRFPTLCADHIHDSMGTLADEYKFRCLLVRCSQEKLFSGFQICEAHLSLRHLGQWQNWSSQYSFQWWAGTTRYSVSNPGLSHTGYNKQSNIFIARH